MGLLLTVFLSSGVSVASHALHCLDHDAAHGVVAHNADCCSVCTFAATPFMEGESLVLGVRVSLVRTGDVVARVFAPVSASSETLFLRGPPCV